MARTKFAARLALDGYQSVSDLYGVLEKKFPAASVALLRAVIQPAEQHNTPLYLVGGSVRDLLLGRPNLDLDLVLEGDAMLFGRRLVKQFGGRLVAHKAFGTAAWWLPENHADLFRVLHMSQRNPGRPPKFLDLITARKEIYPRPAALPKVQFAGIREDQFRRDFTINTLAIRLDGADAGRLLDPWGGLKDLRAGLLRTLHPLSFSDDPTRILRILRLAGRLGFKIETSTLRQFKTHLPVLGQVSGERIRNELELVLAEKERASILSAMQKQGVLRTIHPKLKLSPSVEIAINKFEIKSASSAQWNLGRFGQTDLAFILWLMHTSAADIKSIAQRLSLRADLHEAILAAARLRTLKNRLPGFSVSQSVLELEKMPDISIYAVYLATKGSTFANRLQKYASKWRNVHPHANGNTLHRLGLKPGPSYKHILGRLRMAWLDGEVRTAKQEQALLKKLLDEYR